MLNVTSFASTATGFSVQFNRAIDTAVLNIYDTQTAGLGMADVTLTGNTTGAIRGSLVVGPGATSVTFIQTGGVLPADTYTVTLRSAATGFRDTTGMLLDGNGDGTPEDNHIAVFTIAPTSGVVLSVPDFSRAPGQPLHLPVTGMGLPLRLSEGVGVTAVSLTLTYDPALLAITGATLGSGVPGGAMVMLDTTSYGVAVINFTSPTTLNSGTVEFIRLMAQVQPTAPYGAQQVLHVGSVQVNAAPSRLAETMACTWPLYPAMRPATAPIPRPMRSVCSASPLRGWEGHDVL